MFFSPKQNRPNEKTWQSPPSLKEEMRSNCSEQFVCFKKTLGALVLHSRRLRWTMPSQRRLSTSALRLCFLTSLESSDYGEVGQKRLKLPFWKREDLPGAEQWYYGLKAQIGCSLRYCSSCRGSHFKEPSPPACSLGAKPLWALLGPRARSQTSTHRRFVPLGRCRFFPHFAR